MKQNGEPTVEEILASIKQVIARDTRIGTACAGSQAEHASCPPNDHASKGEEDVLDLADAARIEDVVEESPLLTEDARSTMRDSLAALAALSGPGASPRIVRSGETSLEGLVRDLLRPALAEWLDQNLPAMVEKLVAAEIARIVGKKG